MFLRKEADRVRIVRLLLGLLLVVAAGCQKTPQQQAYDELVGKRGVTWAPGNFLDAAKNGQTDVVTLFLRAGMNSESEDAQGKTALIWAAAQGHAETVKALLANGADPNNSDNEGKTALMWAARWDHIDCALALLNKGANVNAKAVDGSTALSIARTKQNADLVKVLEEAGASQS
jgi:ankyrin repeat protein